MPSTSGNFQNKNILQLNIVVRPSYPLRVSPKQGKILPNEDVAFTVTWIPTGAVLLASSLKLFCNAGTFDISASGVGVFPTFIVEVRIGFISARENHTCCNFEGIFFFTAEFMAAVRRLCAGYSSHSSVHDCKQWQGVRLHTVLHSSAK
jgi:hypothetical protein